MKCPESRVMDTQTFIGFGAGATKVAAHNMAKASCDQQAQAVANQFAALVKCEGNCKPVGSIRIVHSQETGPIEVAPNFWICILSITYDLIVSCVQPVVLPPQPPPLQPKTAPGDIAPIDQQTTTDKPKKGRK